MPYFQKGRPSKGTCKFSACGVEFQRNSPTQEACSLHSEAYRLEKDRERSKLRRLKGKK